MSLLTLANTRCAYGTQIVLDGATVSIEAGEKIGLVGRNGSGKTTLMRVMLGDLEPDDGIRQVRRNARVGYLRQNPSFPAGETVFDAAEGAFAELHVLHQSLREVYDRMAEAEGGDLERLMRRHADLETRLESAGGYTVNHRIEASLHGLGFVDEQFMLQTSVLSGGQLARLGLARLLLETPDLLLLDEPTNHLDIDGRQWLEQFLAEEYREAVVLVSHDRWLLDRVVDRIIEVERGVVRSYPGNYSKYTEIRDHQRAMETRTHEKQLDHIRREETFIRRYKAGQRSKQARGRESRLDRFRDQQLVERPVDLDVMRLKLPTAARPGDQVISADGLSKRYGDTVLFEDLSVSIARGDRVGIIGPNGVGKTTLLRCLLGDLEPDTGEARLGARLSVGYYHQQPDQLDPTLSVWQHLQSVIVALDGSARASEQQARDLAGAFLFSGDEQDKLLSDLSGGELSRVRLAGLVAGAHNLLVMDEPTNHLDIPSAERLERALGPDGNAELTLLIVTHDRALLESLCNQLIVFDGHGEVSLHVGNYSSLIRRREKRARTDATRTVERREAAAGSKVGDRPAVTARAGRKKKPGKGSLASSSLSSIEREIETLQSAIAQIDEQLMDPEVYTDGSRSRTLQQDRAKHVRTLTPLEDEWARRAEEG